VKEGLGLSTSTGSAPSLLGSVAVCLSLPIAWYSFGLKPSPQFLPRVVPEPEPDPEPLGPELVEELEKTREPEEREEPMGPEGFPTDLLQR
jgi:hypothetical protein